MSIPVCRHCNKAIGQQAEKALSGEVQMVWADVLEGDWVCDVTGDEHCPTHAPCEHSTTTTKARTTFSVGGVEVAPTLRQRVGMLVINLGGWLLKGSVPDRIEYHREPPKDES